MKDLLNKITGSRVYQSIKQFSFPPHSKQYIQSMLRRMKTLLQNILLWLCSKKHFWTVFSIGIAITYLARMLPLIGSVMATLVLVLSALHGYAIQIQADRELRFRNAYRYQHQEPDYYDTQLM